MNEQPLRSVLYMPGSNQRAMDKARGLAADAIIFDLEDAVAPEAKVAARAAVEAQLSSGGYGERLLVVRCNGLETAWGADDVRAICATGAAALCLPKIEQVAQLERVRVLLRETGRGHMPLWPMIETPRGVANAAAIAAVDTVDVLVMGTTDLASEMRVPHRPDRLGLQYALGQAVLAARMHGKCVIDGVYLDLGDADGLLSICEQGRALGFDGKSLIHPSQIDAANRAFGPAPADVERARRLLEAWSQAQAEGAALAVLDGKLVEIMHVDDARHTLALAEAIARLEADAGA